MRVAGQARPWSYAMSTSDLRGAVARAFTDLEAKGLLTTMDPDTTGVICRGFDRNPGARGYACLIDGDEGPMVDFGGGVGDYDDDLEVARVVRDALLAHGLAVAWDGDPESVMHVRVAPALRPLNPQGDPAR